MKFKSAALVVLLFIGGSDARSARSSRSSVMSRQTSNTLAPPETVIVPILTAPGNSSGRRKSHMGHKALNLRPRIKRAETVSPRPLRIEKEEKSQKTDFTNAELRLFDWLNQESVFSEPVKGVRLRRDQSFENFSRSYSSFF